MAKSKSKVKKNPIKKIKKIPVKEEKEPSKTKITFKISSIAAIIYAAIIIPVIMFGGIATGTLTLKLVDSVLLIILTILAVVILKSYYLLTKRKKFANIMTKVMIVFTIIVGVFNILKLYVLGPAIILYIIAWAGGLVYILFGIGLFQIKRVRLIFIILAVFYIIAGVFNASLLLMVLLPAMAVTTAIVEAVVFRYLSR